MARPRHPRPAARPSSDEAKIHLQILGQDHEIGCTVRLGRTRLSELVPLARSISASIVAIATEYASSQGKTISCTLGCDHCCRQLVPVAPLEAKRLAEVVATMPAEKRARVLERFAQAIAALEQAGLIEAKSARSRSAMISKEKDTVAAWNDVSRRYYELHLDCPFLENNACTIYDERPLACREYNAVTNPKLCEEFSNEIETLERPVRSGEVLTRAGNDIAKTNMSAIPLPLVLEWAHTHAKRLTGEYDGEAMFWALVQAMEESS